MNNEKAVILFDGVCNLCTKSVQQIITRDKNVQFLFASLQSEFGQKFLKENNLPDQNFDTFIIKLPNNQYFTKSDAFIQVLKLLPSLYPLLGKLLQIIPHTIRNTFYDFIAKNRFKFFGKKSHCMIPKPEWKNRFLD